MLFIRPLRLNGKTLVSGHPWMCISLTPAQSGSTQVVNAGSTQVVNAGSTQVVRGREGLFPWTAIPLDLKLTDSNLTFKDSKTKMILQPWSHV